MTGSISTHVLPVASSLAEVIGNSADESTVRVAVDNLAMQMLSNGPIKTAFDEKTPMTYIAATWAALSAITGSAAGIGASVRDIDTGTHIDPVVGGTVQNSGVYTWSVVPIGWRWLDANNMTAASDAEAIAGIAINRTVTPANLPAVRAATRATDVEAIAGTDATHWISPANLPAVRAATRATNEEAIAGTEDAPWLSPVQDRAALDARVGAVSMLDPDRFEGAVTTNGVVGSDRRLVDYLDDSGIRVLTDPVQAASINGVTFEVDTNRWEGCGQDLAWVGSDRRLIFGSASPAKAPPDRIAYSVDDGTGHTQIFSEVTATGVRTRLSAVGSNEIAPRLDGSGNVVWQSDRAGGAPGGLYFAPVAGGAEHPVLPHRRLACWGDSLTAQDWMASLAAAGLSVTYYNFGRSGDTSLAVASRMGAVQTFYLVAGASIPASGAVTLTRSSAARGDPLKKYGDPACAVMGWLGGVWGTLAKASGELGNVTFTRAASGPAVSAPTVTPFVWAPSPTGDIDPTDTSGLITNAREMTQVFFVGRNDAAATAAILTNIRSMIAAIESYSRRFVVVPYLLNQAETAGTVGARNRAALLADCLTAWPDNTLDLLSSFLAGGNGSTQDNTDVANGVPPTSLMQSDGIHPNSAGRAVEAAAFVTFANSKELLS